MYRLATKRTKKVEENTNVFLRQTIRRALLVLRSVILWLSELLNFGLNIIFIMKIVHKVHLETLQRK